jgi:ubiquinone/menaquinone biosynthesis C-methylase UbiE
MTDYDRTDIPAAYDRARDHGPEMLDLWMNAIAVHLADQSITHILDLGCGTGRFSKRWPCEFNAEVIGLDPSVKMLQACPRKAERQTRSLPTRPRRSDPFIVGVCRLCLHVDEPSSLH